ncbi:MAG TPA: hypothetical protein VJU59_51180 [Paraburkholderia sp.]|nr:hypothetical protein [Paraburkholderia sp.]HKR47946.1 hypothetical protein [Paraburkholderia sp.]
MTEDPVATELFAKEVMPVLRTWGKQPLVQADGTRSQVSTTSDDA